LDLLDEFGEKKNTLLVRGSKKMPPKKKTLIMEM
jgi:hypothetical protein